MALLKTFEKTKLKNCDIPRVFSFLTSWLFYGYIGMCVCTCMHAFVSEKESVYIRVKVYMCGRGWLTCQLKANWSVVWTGSADRRTGLVWVEGGWRGPWEKEGVAIIKHAPILLNCHRWPHSCIWFELSSLYFLIIKYVYSHTHRHTHFCMPQFMKFCGFTSLNKILRWVQQTVCR